jgi:arylsulfatase A-like enzyme
MYPLDEVQPVVVPAGDRENKPVAALADRKYQAQMTDLQKKQAIQAYYASISFIDAQLGRVTAALERLELDDNTLVVFMSDHGYQLGLHGLWQKRDLFKNSTRTPLILVAPDQLAAGQRSSILVELVDIYPTLVALAGLPGSAGSLEGKNLQAILQGSMPGREFALSQSWSAAHLTRPEWRGREVMGYSIRTDHYRYTEWGGGEYGTELYDYRKDPSEFANLAGEAGYEEVAKQMKLLLDNKLRMINKPGD